MINWIKNDGELQQQLLVNDVLDITNQIDNDEQKSSDNESMIETNNYLLSDTHAEVLQNMGNGLIANIELENLDEVSEHSSTIQGSLQTDIKKDSDESDGDGGSDNDII